MLRYSPLTCARGNRFFFLFSKEGNLGSFCVQTVPMYLMALLMNEIHLACVLLPMDLDIDLCE